MDYSARHNLPASLTSFVGREREMLEAKRLLPMTRILTLTGAGGSGKTRLALEVARDLVSTYSDGVWLVELAGLSEPELVAQEVAGALEVPERPGQPLTDTLVDVLGDKGNVATALNSLGTLAAYQGDHERARVLLEENLEVLQQLEEEGNAATTLKRYHALNLLGFLAVNQEDDYARGAELWEESLALAREAGDTYRVGISLTGLGYAALLQGDYEQATTRCEETLVFARDLGSAGVELIPENLINLGLAARDRGEHERAATSFNEALAVSWGEGRKPSVINALEGMASLAGALEEDTRAAQLWGAAEAAREVTGIALPSGERALHEPYLAAARSRLGEAVWEEALSEGRAMSLEEAAEYALSKEETDLPTIPVPEELPAGEPLSELTPREQEVAVLVARGLTNRQISTKLGISERTAGNHVARILSKLGLRSRAQIATWATEHKLLTPPDPD